MSLFPRFVSHNNEFTPLFRLLDDFATVSRSGFPSNSGVRAFAPKFDVHELKDAYELHGELPGIEQNDINIQWEDAQTLSVKGRVERRSEQGEKPASAASETPAEQQPEEQPDYQKPTVEDEWAEVEKENPTDEENAVAKTTEAPQEVQKKPENAPRTWISERSVGEFARTFSFPSRVDQDNVKASLKNGILSVVVPKAQPPQPRKINVE